jgi:selenocysteine-specific translation elongation factor
VVVVTGTQAFHRDVPEAEAGRTWGCLLRGVKRDELVRGQVLAAPGSIERTRPRATRSSTCCRRRRAAAHTPFGVGYTPQFFFGTTDVTGTIERVVDAEVVAPGARATVDFALEERAANGAAIGLVPRVVRQEAQAVGGGDQAGVQEVAVEPDQVLQRRAAGEPQAPQGLEIDQHQRVRRDQHVTAVEVAVEHAVRVQGTQQLGRTQHQRALLGQEVAAVGGGEAAVAQLHQRGRVDVLRHHEARVQRGRGLALHEAQRARASRCRWRAVGGPTGTRAAPASAGPSR